MAKCCLGVLGFISHQDDETFARVGVDGGLS